MVTGWKGADTTYAAANAVPDYEVKFLLDSKQILEQNGALKNSVSSAFNMNGAAKRLSVEYFDTNGLDLNGAGWNVRFRKKEDKKNYELAYKKRYTIVNGDIQAALTKANAEGFNASDDNYEAEVDWGYGKQTLSFTTEKKVDAAKGLSLPAPDQALGMLLTNLPGKLKNAGSSNWGKDMLAKSREHGPVSVSKYEGTFNGLETDIEVWPIRSANGSSTENIIEVSFKTTDYQAASDNRSKLMALLQAKGWLVPQDSLKTNLVLERY